MKFSHRKFSGLDGMTYEEFVLEGVPDRPLTLSSSKAGVTIRGQAHLETYDELQAFAKVMAQAWEAHRRLMPKIDQNIPGDFLRG